MSANYQYILGCFIVATHYFTQLFSSPEHEVLKALAEICEDGTRCTGGKHCCSVGCCFGDEDDDDDRRYSYGYRLSIWNMWYFWFVILFLMMSCFGGCGYYKQRQRLIRGQNLANGRSIISVLGAPIYRRNRTPVEVYPNVAGVYPIFHASTEPNTEANNLEPPPYTEVMSHPDLFPANTKTPSTNQEPYLQGPPGYPVNSMNNETTNQMPQPPPYSEVANQGATNMPSANQNASIQNQPPNQNGVH